MHCKDSARTELLGLSRTWWENVIHVAGEDLQQGDGGLACKADPIFCFGLFLQYEDHLSTGNSLLSL